MSPENTHKPIRIYIGGLILGVNTLYMLYCFFELFAVVGNELTTCLSFKRLAGLVYCIFLFRMVSSGTTILKPYMSAEPKCIMLLLSRIWDIGRGACLKILEGHNRSVR